MSCCSEQQRVGCAVGGIYTALAMENVLPIMHCGPGCQDNAGGVLAGTNGGQNAGTYQESIIPCTDFCEADVIFGGSERLRVLIEKSLEYYKSDLFIVVDGCTAEIVGDDIEEVVSSFEGSRIPVIYSQLPGFKGNNIWGHTQILTSIIEQYLKPSDKINSRQVNVWGIVPYYDTMWFATLEKLEELLSELGLKPNIIYGRSKGIKEINKIPEAEFNLLLSPWVDLEIVQLLEKKFNTPFFQFPDVPVGPTETTKFIREIVKYAKLNQIHAEKHIKEQENRYYYYIKRHMAWLYACKIPPKEFFINSSASVGLSLTRYLVNDLGLIPDSIYIVDDVPESRQKSVEKLFYDIELDNKDFKIIFTNDGGLLNADIRDQIFLNKVCIFGSTWDELLAKNKRIPFLPVSAPYGDVIVGNKTYFGYDGAISFFTDFYTDVANKGFSSL